VYEYAECDLMHRRLPALLAVAVAATSLTAISPSVAQATSSLELQWELVHPERNDSSAPTIGDVDNDGVNEIVFGSLAGKVWVLEADGSVLWTADTTIAGQSTPSAVNSAPVVADIDNDGDVEIIVGVGSLQVPNQQGGVVALDHNGSRLWSHQGFDTFNMWTDGGPDGYKEGVYSSPAVGDIDGDGFLDIVFGGWDNRIWALDRNGNPLSGFPFVHYDTTWGSPSLFDVDNDGREEIFLGGDASIGPGLPNSTLQGGRFRVLDWANGTISERYPAIERNDIFQSSSVIGDINGDGRMEVVVGGSVQFYSAAPARQVWAFHADDGSMLPGFPVQLPGRVFSTPALGDVDGDGQVEIVVNTMNEGPPGSGGVSGRIVVIENNGAVKWTADALEGDFPGAIISYLASPIIIDADGDGDLDIVAQSNVFTFVVEGSTGRRLPGGMLNRNEAWAGAGAPLAADFGPAGWLLIISSFQFFDGPGYIRAYSIPDQESERTWPMWRGNPAHTAAPVTGVEPLPAGQCRTSANPPAAPSPSSSSGYWILHTTGKVDAFAAPHYGDLPTNGTALPPGFTAISITETPSGKGYWILDSAGIVYTFGDAVDHGSAAGLDLKAPIISMAALPTGDGYWLLASDGGVFSYGDAKFWGSTGALALNAPIISMAPTAEGKGYWLLASDGGVFSFGNAKFHGSTGALTLAAPVISMAVHPSGSGYWLLGSDGGVFSFSVPYWGSLPGLGLCDVVPVTELRPTSAGNGYFAMAQNGAIYTFGDALYRGGVSDGTPIDLAVRRF